LVVVLDEFHFVLLVADLDAAGGVDFIAPQLGALEFGHGIDIERTGARHGHADRYGVVVGGECRRREQRRTGRNNVKPFHIVLPFLPEQSRTPPQRCAGTHEICLQPPQSPAVLVLRPFCSAQTFAGGRNLRPGHWQCQ
jgi:hypothetical protein